MFVMIIIKENEVKNDRTTFEWCLVYVTLLKEQTKKNVKNIIVDYIFMNEP